MFAWVQPWLQRKAVSGTLVFVVFVVLVVIFRGGSSPETVESIENTPPLVELTSVTELAGARTLSLIGTARAFTEANVTTEAAGRVTAVNVTLGQTVAAGQVIAVLENASERAAVLQAEGAYEAALSAAEQSGVSVEEANIALRNAQNSAVDAYKGAYTTVNGIILNTIDPFFSNPNGTIPGLRIDGRGNTTFLNTERVAFQTLLAEWQTSATSLTRENVAAELTTAQAHVARTITLVDTFIAVFNTQSSSRSYTDAELTSFSTTFNGVRSTLVAVQSSLESAETSIASAREAIARAELGAVGSQNSAADAQVKQALGNLRAAQANLDKTILRTPIAGTVNELNVRIGDFVNNFTAVAKVANNNALEIITFVGENERDVLRVDDEVTIAGRAAGRVVAVAPAIDSVTRKIEVRIATDDASITNGDTVRITKELTSATTTTGPLMVPLTAVKLKASDGSVFVVENGVLVAVPVTLGAVRGAQVEIVDGITRDTEFVLDARGLNAGEAVTVAE